jgi:uncharacterized damage-inducible protein DinB
MRDREHLLDELQASRDEMRAVLARVSPDQEIYPGWTVKQLLAHITGWDEAVNASLRAHLGCGEPDLLTITGIDSYNAESVAARETQSLEEVMHGFNLARRELIALVREIPEERWDEDHLYAWGERGTVSKELAIFIHHEREHAVEIRAMLG